MLFTAGSSTTYQVPKLFYDFYRLTIYCCVEALRKLNDRLVARSSTMPCLATKVVCITYRALIYGIVVAAGQVNELTKSQGRLRALWTKYLS